MAAHRLAVAAAVAALLLAARSLHAQHCAPLYESFLAEVSVKKVDDRLRIHAQYAKEGGAGPKDAYQGYLIAYLDRDAASVPGAAPGDVIDPKVALVLHTQVMRRNEKADATGPWTYDLDFSIACAELVDKVLAYAALGAKDRSEDRLWHYYRHRIRLAVFVPFLEDAKYSVLEGLPKERHECNYDSERALVFQALPFGLQFLVSRSPDTKGRVWLRVLGDKPAPAAGTTK